MVHVGKYSIHGCFGRAYKNHRRSSRSSLSRCFCIQTGSACGTARRLQVVEPMVGPVVRKLRYSLDTFNGGWCVKTSPGWWFETFVDLLGGGFKKKIFCPYLWKWSNFDQYFSNGLVQPPTIVTHDLPASSSRDPDENSPNWTVTFFGPKKKATKMGPLTRSRLEEPWCMWWF